MTDIIDKAVERLKTKLPSFTGGTARFVVPGHGTILLDQSGPRAGDGPADVTLTASADVFQGILAGEVNATMAYMTGKLTVDGDMGLAIQLGSRLG